MIIKEEIKRELDNMPDDLLAKVYNYIHSLKSKKIRRKKLHTFNLKGELDNVNIRKRAYE